MFFASLSDSFMLFENKIRGIPGGIDIPITFSCIFSISSPINKPEPPVIIPNIQAVNTTPNILTSLYRLYKCNYP